MKVKEILRSKSKFLYIYLLIFSVFNSGIASFLLYFINTKLVGDKLPYLDQYDTFVFAAVILVSFIISASFEVYMVRLTQKIGIELSTYLFGQLRLADYQKYLKLTEEKVRTVMHDVNILQNVPNTILGFLRNISMILVGVGYLLFSNFLAASVLLTIIVIMVVFFVIRLRSIQEDKDTARDLLNDFKRLLNDFLRGFRELRMSVARSENFFSNYLMQNLKERMQITLKFTQKLIKTEIISKHAVYVIIGVILFVLPQVASFTADSKVVFITTFLFISGPIASIINNMNAVGTIVISLQRIDEFEKTLQSHPTSRDQSFESVALVQPFSRLQLQDIEFEYDQREKNGSSFKLRIPELEIKRGEIIFVTGGNGSGKSTFANILAGLFVPTAGQLYFNGVAIINDNYSHYRNCLSCIFQDNHLFSENYDNFDLSATNTHLSSWLNRMQLQEVAKFDTNRNNIFTNLSKGQQKRLAFIYAMLEANDILLLDEWAAEQDPIFRAAFYLELLPLLREKGTTVVAITHDDAYFECADRILKFEYGQISQDLILSKEKLTRPILTSS